jgi:hypothetical protein
MGIVTRETRRRYCDTGCVTEPVMYIAGTVTASEIVRSYSINGYI